MASEDRRDAIDEEAPDPIWVQVAADLRARITEGHLTGRLPGESTLADDYGVARNTVRKAIADLAARGLVRVVQGRGTFVTRAED